MAARVEQKYEYEKEKDDDGVIVAKIHRHRPELGVVYNTTRFESIRGNALLGGGIESFGLLDLYEVADASE